MANAVDESQLPGDADQVLTEWKVLNDEFDQLSILHRQYVTQLNELHKLQSQCSKVLTNQTSKMHQLRTTLKRMLASKQQSAENSRAPLVHMQTEMAQRMNRLNDMEDHLPKTNNGLYLNIILGHVNVSITNKNDKFRYKDEYEKFKLTVTVVALISSVLALLLNHRAMDAILNFLLVWYYCTLTIRESILRVNGSRIKGWWVAHHYVSAVLCGVMITWPDGLCYQSYRKQLLLFSAYLAIVQTFQTTYQRGCLYRLRALGERHWNSMDISFEGFHSWMYKGLSFLLPFLFVGYVLGLATLFLIIFIANTVTTLAVVVEKIRTSNERDLRKTKYLEQEIDSSELQTSGSEIVKKIK